MGKGKNRRNRQNKKYFFMGGNTSSPPKKRDQTCEKSETKKTIGSSGSGTSYPSWSGSNSYTPQPVQNPDNVINTDKGCFEFVHSAAWGTVLVPVKDPKAVTVSHDEINSIKLIENFPKIPAPLWARWMALCFHFCPEKTPFSVQNSGQVKPVVHQRWNVQTSQYDYWKYVDGKEVPASKDEWISSPTSPPSSSSGLSCHSGELEVSMLLCRKRDDLSQWRILVPKQVVTGASVNADLSETIDIETGERFKVFPPDGWVHAGSSHSHNTMAAFFSSTDDKSELTVPGLHIVIGKIDKKNSTYEFKASIVIRQLRKNVSLFDVVDAKPVDDVRFHADVLELIKVNKPTYNSGGYGGGNYYHTPSYPSSVHSKSPPRDYEREGGWGAWGWDSFDEDRPGPSKPTSKESFPAERRPITLHDLAGEYYGDGDGDDALYYSLHPAVEEPKAADDKQLPVLANETNPSRKKSLEELERSLERAIDGVGDLNVDDIMAYYEKIGLPYNPGEWSGL